LQPIPAGSESRFRDWLLGLSFHEYSKSTGDEIAGATGAVTGGQRQERHLGQAEACPTCHWPMRIGSEGIATRGDMRLGGGPLLHERMGQDLVDCDGRVVAFDLHVDLG
jgi:hypothetical protein